MEDMFNNYRMVEEVKERAVNRVEDYAVGFSDYHG